MAEGAAQGVELGAGRSLEIVLARHPPSNRESSPYSCATTTRRPSKEGLRVLACAIRVQTRSDQSEPFPLPWAAPPETLDKANACQGAYIKVFTHVLDSRIRMTLRGSTGGHLEFMYVFDHLQGIIGSLGKAIDATV